MTNLELAEKLEKAASEFSPIQYGLLRVIHEVTQELRAVAEPRANLPPPGYRALPIPTPPQNDYAELHRLIHAAWYNAGQLLSRDDSPFQWIREIRNEWVEICVGRRTMPQPVSSQKYQTTPGTIDGPCIHCGKPFAGYHVQDAETCLYMCIAQNRGAEPT